MAFGYCGEDLQFKSGVDRFAQLISVDGVEEAYWSGRLLQRWRGHEFPPVVRRAFVARMTAAVQCPGASLGVIFKSPCKLLILN
jgi:hypothetical protein